MGLLVEIFVLMSSSTVATQHNPLEKFYINTCFVSCLSSEPIVGGLKHVIRHVNVMSEAEGEDDLLIEL